MSDKHVIDPHPLAQEHPKEPRCPECGALLVPGAIWAHRFVHWGDDIPNHIRYEGAQTRYKMLHDVAERFGE